MPTTEERLAALEAKMAQLTDTRPTTYYMHQYSGEEIDAAVGRALTGGALDTSVTNVSNQLGTFVRPNLLDNWDFSVWQRCSDGEYNGVPDGIYVPDRWIITSSNGSVSTKLIKSTPYGGLSNSVGPNCRITQRLENAAQYNKMTLTLSVLKNTGLHSKTIVASNWDNSTDIFAQFSSAVAWLNAGETFIAAKLELGPTQTLAHQDAAGNWVLNEVPDYGEQLRRCQRYYIKYDTIKANGYISNAAKSYYMPIFLPEAMRIKPTILGTPKIRVRFNGGYSARFIGGTFTAPDSWSVVGISSNSCVLSFNVSTAVDPNNIPVSIEVEGLELSADL